MRNRAIIGVLFLIILAVLAFSACGGGGKHRTPVLPSLRNGPEGLTQPDGGLLSRTSPVEVSLDEALTELDALETPDGVSAELFQQLKDELAKQLSAKGVSKIASTPPTGEANRVDDLELIDNGDGTYTLTWSYKNVGDYDQNGTVGISDITPMAMHYGETATPDNEWIDGSGNNVVDIADITPIAMNYGVVVGAYALEESLDTVDFIELSRASLVTDTTGHLQLDIALETPVEGYYYRVSACESGQGATGIGSNMIHFPSGESLRLVLILVTAPAGGTGSLSERYIVVDGVPYQLEVQDMTTGDVSTQVVFETRPPFFLEVSTGLPRILSITSFLAGDFRIQATTAGDPEQRSNFLHFRVEHEVL